MNNLENGMVMTDYTPMVDSDRPVCSCDWCGCDIYPGEKYIDLGDKICAECISEHMKEA